MPVPCRRMPVVPEVVYKNPVLARTEERISRARLQERKRGLFQGLFECLEQCGMRAYLSGRT